MDEWVHLAVLTLLLSLEKEVRLVNHTSMINKNCSSLLFHQACMLTKMNFLVGLRMEWTDSESYALG